MDTKALLLYEREWSGGGIGILKFDPEDTTNKSLSWLSTLEEILQSLI
jgi:hypothetical protein